MSPACNGVHGLLHSLLATVAAIAAFALLTVAMPGPILVDLLGAGLASLGLGIIYDGC